MNFQFALKALSLEHEECFGQEVCDLLVSYGGKKMAPVSLQEEGFALMAIALRNPPLGPPEEPGEKPSRCLATPLPEGLVEFALGLIPGLDK